MTLESAAQIATIVGAIIAVLVALAAFIKFVSPWIKRKLEGWWNKTRARTEFTLGYKTELVGGKTSSPEYEIGYLFISYETTHKRRWTDWKFRTLHSFYNLNLIDKLPKFESVARYGWINNLIKFEEEKGKIGKGVDSYIYRNTNALAFYPIKQFAQVPKWAELPYIEQQTRTYFKSYENRRQNQRDLLIGTKWVKYEDIEIQMELFITYMNRNHNRDPLMPESKKIKKLLKKGFKKQFVEGKIGDIISINKKIER